MSQEIERAYRVNEALLPSLDDVPSKHLSQVYFTPYPNDERFPEIASGEWRVRTTTENDTVKYKAAVKIGDKASGSRTEIEVDLSPGDFGTTEADTAEFGYGIISKTRYELGDNLTLDKFDGNSVDLKWLAEKEFDSEEEMKDWVPPEWCEPANNLPGNRALARPLSPVAETTKKSDETLVQAIIRKQREHGHVVVTISGMSASGKGTEAQKLAAHFNGSHIEADNYHIGAAALTARDGEINHDLPSAYDYERAARDLASLLEGQVITVPKYDFKTSEPLQGDGIVVSPALKGITIIDGLYAKRISDHLKEIAPGIATHDVLINTPLYVCVLRRMLRDCGLLARAVKTERDSSMDAETTLRYLHKVAIPTYRKYAHHPEKFDHVLGQD